MLLRIIVICTVLGFSVCAQAYKTEVLNSALERPWSLALLPDGKFLVTEKAGKLSMLNSDGSLAVTFTGLPEVAAVGQGGLFDVVAHPDFANNQWIYLSYSAGSRLTGYNTEVIRATLQNNQLINHKKIFAAKPRVRGGRHFGGRLLFDREGYLFISLGDRGRRQEAQNPANHIGSLVRLKDDGSVPADNPFVNTPDHRPEIYSYGHRNIQGMALHPQTGALWVHEHGPQGGDEINRISAGSNYGWPKITYGREYGTGFKIGEGTATQGVEAPLHHWVPSIAPSGMAFYQSGLLVGALKYQLVASLALQGRGVGEESRYFANQWGRIRDVRADKDRVYLLTDDEPGKLIRISGFDLEK